MGLRIFFYVCSHTTIDKSSKPKLLDKISFGNRGNLSCVIFTENCSCMLWIARASININERMVRLKSQYSPKANLFVEPLRLFPYSGVRVMVFNTTFNNISVISWWSVLLVEETRVPRENHPPVASHWQTLSHNVATSTPHLSGIHSQLQRW